MVFIMSREVTWYKTRGFSTTVRQLLECDLRQSEVMMCVLERVMEFLYEILQWWSGWWSSGGQQEKVSCFEKVRRVVVGVFRESEFIMCVL